MTPSWVGRTSHDKVIIAVFKEVALECDPAACGFGNVEAQSLTQQ